MAWNRLRPTRDIRLSYLLFLLTLLLIALTCPSVVCTEVLQSYCESESFHAKCWPDQVIAMRSAAYGRMRLGRCVEADLGYLGCAKDVLEIADRRCSGKQECEIRIPDGEFDKTKPCYKELKVYLEANYSCLPGKWTERWSFSWCCIIVVSSAVYLTTMICMMLCCVTVLVYFIIS